jgi:hypothetical protein
MGSGGACDASGITVLASGDLMRLRQLAVPLVVAATSCHLLGDFDELQGVDGDQCLSKNDCPGDDTECRMRVCNAGTCGEDFAPQGTPCVNGAKEGSCFGGECGAPMVCQTDADCGGTTPYCHPASRTCVECRASLHCGDSAPICHEGTGVCVDWCGVLAPCPGSGKVCVEGNCVCSSGLHPCGSPPVCADLLSSHDHCGGCFQECLGPCIGGQCPSHWLSISPASAPSPRADHVAERSHNGKLFIWGGATGTDPTANTDSGGLYDPPSEIWTPTTTTGSPSPRREAIAVGVDDWHQVFVWGGFDGTTELATGAIYDLTAETWQPATMTGAPSPRRHHTAVWTGAEVIIWGGTDGTNQLADGARYDPSTDTWKPMAAAPLGRELHTATNVAGDMIVVGGIGDPDTLDDVYLPAGSAPAAIVYRPADDQWVPLETANQPAPRAMHTTAPYGSTFLVWGGSDGSSPVSAGAWFQPSQWTTVTSTLLSPRWGHTAARPRDTDMLLIWGGMGSEGAVSDGAVFSFITQQWTSHPPSGLSPRSGHTAAPSTYDVAIWGGRGPSGELLNDGAIYVP